MDEKDLIAKKVAAIELYKVHNVNFRDCVIAIAASFVVAGAVMSGFTFSAAVCGIASVWFVFRVWQNMARMKYLNNTYQLGFSPKKNLKEILKQD